MSTKRQIEAYRKHLPWNPVTGCTRVSSGCENGYIEHNTDERTTP